MSCEKKYDVAVSLPGNTQAEEQYETNVLPAVGMYLEIDSYHWRVVRVRHIVTKDDGLELIAVIADKIPSNEFLH